MRVMSFIPLLNNKISSQNNRPIYVMVKELFTSVIKMYMKVNFNSDYTRDMVYSNTKEAEKEFLKEISMKDNVMVKEY